MKEELLQYIELMIQLVDTDIMLKPLYIEGYKRALTDLRQVLLADFDIKKQEVL